MIKTSNIDAIMQPNRIVDGSFGNADDNEYLRAILWELRTGGTPAFCSCSKHVNSQEPEGGYLLIWSCGDNSYDNCTSTKQHKNSNITKTTITLAFCSEIRTRIAGGN